MVADGWSLSTLALNDMPLPRTGTRKGDANIGGAPPGIKRGEAVDPASGPRQIPAMDHAPARFWYDYVDPVSFLVEIRLCRAEARVGTTVERRGWEIAPPPTPLLDADDPTWIGRWEETAREATGEGVELARPARVPWTRKAHELALHAAASDAFPTVHDALFRAYHQERLDIGRVDVLAGIADRNGLDPGEARTVLGIDRYLPEVRSRRQEAEREGVRGVPTLAREGRRLEGLADEETLTAFLAD